MSRESKIEILLDRAHMLATARIFFKKARVVEVDCPALSRLASVDAHIDLVEATPLGDRAFLHSSPEYGMKRLLAAGIGDIFQISHVFRDGEFGPKHNPEFTICEWYREGISFEEMMKETCSFIQLFVGKKQIEIKSYERLFLEYLAINPFTATLEELQKISGESFVDRDDQLNLLLATKVEPHLGQKKLTVLAYYPPSQAALAKTRKLDGHEVAERFEVYCDGIELANGYHELQDHEEQRRRFQEANCLRLKMGKKQLPCDERFLEALQKGLPECCGVAVGFDRLMMVRHNKKSLSDVMPFVWDEA